MLFNVTRVLMVVGIGNLQIKEINERLLVKWTLVLCHDLIRSDLQAQGNVPNLKRTTRLKDAQMGESNYQISGAPMQNAWGTICSHLP